jgi:hypothetical protein
MLPETLPVRPLSTGQESLSTQVVSYEEVRRAVRAGDNYESLSKEYYNSEGYAKALQLWNQNHPRASDVMARDGSLVPGEKIFIPPAAQLEQHYAQVITSPKIAPRPSGAVQTGFTAPATEPATYRVVTDESIEVVARRTLGTSDRAIDVLRLNPKLRAGEVLKAGTVVTLPAEARVPPDNVVGR